VSGTRALRLAGLAAHRDSQYQRFRSPNADRDRHLSVAHKTVEVEPKEPQDVALLPPRIGLARADSEVLWRVRAEEEAAAARREREESQQREAELFDQLHGRGTNPVAGVAAARRPAGVRAYRADLER
jgi:hypothetical protein